MSGGSCPYCTFNYESEAPNAARLNSNEEVFPEPRAIRTDLLAGTPFTGHRFNHFLPWMINQDGSELEVLNHLGRHELHRYFNRSRNDDPKLVEMIAAASGRVNPNSIENMFQLSEDPNEAGLYYGIDAAEFGTHAAGQIVSLGAPPTQNADTARITYLTPPDRSTGLFRSPLRLVNDQLIAVYTDETRDDENEGSRANPSSRYDFRLYMLEKQGSFWEATTPLTQGISKNINYYDPDVNVSYNGELWELDPVEVRVRVRPPTTHAELPSIEANVFSDLGININTFKQYLQANELALIVSRDVTSRDDADRQQPYNLRVLGTNTMTLGDDGHIYDVEYLQFFEGKLIRGLTFGRSAPVPGRRVLAQAMDNNLNGSTDGPEGSVPVASDGSVAAFVPAERALTWQLTDDVGEGVVLERNWLTFQAGEVRVCASCHGLNDKDQAGNGEPQNEPLALRQLLQSWQQEQTP